MRLESLRSQALMIHLIIIGIIAALGKLDLILYLVSATTITPGHLRTSLRCRVSPEIIPHFINYILNDLVSASPNGEEVEECRDQDRICNDCHARYINLNSGQVF